LALTEESKVDGHPTAPRKGFRWNIVNGALLGIVLQLAGLYTRLDGLTAILGIFAIVLWILGRLIPLGPLHSPPPSRSDESYWEYKREIGLRKFVARVDLGAWGGSMVLVEVVATILYFVFGFHLPVAPGVH
jgi:hypothetical protein